MAHACRRVLAAAPVLVALGAAAPADTLANTLASEPPPSLQAMRIAAQVLGFQETPPAGVVTLAIAFDPAIAGSRDEAIAVAGLLGDGLLVGALTLRPLLLEQNRLAGSDGYAAVYAADGVDQALLRGALQRRHVPCLTRHVAQVESGACTVAIRAVPNVEITVNEANASGAGVRFATAFRMMVREI